jgi:hypothetical protein
VSLPNKAREFEEPSALSVSKLTDRTWLDTTSTALASSPAPVFVKEKGQEKCQYPFQWRQLGDEKALSTLICDRLSFCLNVAFIVSVP